MNLDHDVIVLTGAGRKGQTGEVIARALADRGARLALVSRGPAESAERAAELRAAGFEAREFACDLTDAAAVTGLARAVAQAYGGSLSALVNVAGGFAMSGAVADSDPAAWQNQFAINLTTAYLATRAFLPALRAARGAIVYFTSAAALPGAAVANMGAYTAAKSGVLALMRAVAQEERTRGVRANAIAPSQIRTAANLAAMGERDAYVSREDVAAVVAWLCSGEARAVTGQVIRLG